MFFDNLVKLIQSSIFRIIKAQYLECEPLQRSTTLHGSWTKKLEKCFEMLESHFQYVTIAYFEQVFVSCNQSSKIN